MSSVAVPSDLEPHQSHSGRKVLNRLEHAAVRLYGHGRGRNTVAEMLAKYMGGKTAAMKRIRAWEETQWFRDAVYDYAMVKADMAVPQVLNGVQSRAKRGRVDAARLMLEVTGRHNPKGEAAVPAVIQINFGGAIPRPDNRPQQLEEAIEDAEVVEDE